MYNKISKLVIYRNLGQDSILFSLADAIEDLRRLPVDSKDPVLKETITTKIYTQINRLLELATEYGFDQNLWHNYLAYILATNENPFSITCEKVGKRDGTVNQFAKGDFKIFKELFDYDFSKIEKELGVNCFSIILNYQAVVKNGKRYNKNVSDKVRFLSSQMEQAHNEDELLSIVTDFYREYGVGKFGLNKAFRVRQEERRVALYPITNTDDIRLSDLVGYEIQKRKLIDNTEAFVEGRKSNNVLLFGDSGTGKSTSVKAILNEYYSRGLRMIEIYKHQFEDLSSVIAQVKNRNYKFIIYMDDLSFEEFEIEYKYLKAVIEGGLETKPDNILIYATSNRRHLIRETWSDRSDISKDELHHSDTMQEKLSLVARFGITINYSAPNQKEYYEIVKGLAKQINGLSLSEEELCAQANMWEMSHGGRSGRTAQQFINYLAGQKKGI
ncbi:ATP-binding protein [Anaerocolumna sp. MB42-C2]|uniref:ATP-binding protein n=1 Tax=Anaerocolumna sp. MB42-C2 TaxID=3070997 RepID=UPI0027E14716|nr:ATP-binding protein [Anaerocolumna sp. MB42-C2]WMJ88740.1 ATP-binding protein [Anaerocolumna sp. MB42-C2]